MVERVESLVRLARKQLGREGYPEPGDLRKLVRLWKPLFSLRRGEVSRCYFDGFGALLVVQRGLAGRPYEEVLAHELGHGLFCCGLADFVRGTDWRSEKIQRLARGTERKEEGLAHQFALAWFLPAPLVLAAWFEPWRIERESGCPAAWVNQRRRELWGIAVGWEPVPEWARG